jgi:hypothetical protein
MLPFGVTIPATVPQGSEIPEGFMNNPVYETRRASNEIFSPSNKIHREVGRAKDLSAPLAVTMKYIYNEGDVKICKCNYYIDICIF